MTDKATMRAAKLRLRQQAAPAEQPETWADVAKALLVLLLVCAAFYAAALLVASYADVYRV